ncbi:hypothetical protein LTR37_013146 [Vermiconidia calcicola]|uniref:Uncharacterized protein n=1 Tax=Vermiconidia calcicola TaxID=1690605 RepID=A0ACC3MX41_9PEZI|nr:hypothetical protein LTR37_013146 [Vermiconidia calcicola]
MAEHRITGEIDIIEFTNNVPNNLMALHTMPGCTIAGTEESGTLLTSDCSAGGGYTGCTVAETAPNNAGIDFNANGGGVYAMEWTSTAIRMWFFPRDAIPDTVTSDTPDVAGFGVPTANFQGSCDIDTHFYNHSIIFDIDFCGQWAGNVFIQNGCPALDPTDSWASCNQFVALNPSAYHESYWQVNHIKVYQDTPGSTPAPSTLLSSATPAISTSGVTTILSGAQGRTSTPTMSLAATVPSITTGAFTATSSVLSVLSSLSEESHASLVNRATSLPSSPTSTATGSSSPISILPDSITLPSPLPSSNLASSIEPPQVTLSSPSMVSVEPTFVTTPGAGSTTSSSWTTSPIIPSTIVCTGDVCTSYTPVVVVETITVNAMLRRDTEISKPSPTADLARREDGVLTVYCDNVEGPLSEWTTSYENAALWIFACALYGDYGAPAKRAVQTSFMSSFDRSEFTPTVFTYQPTTSAVAVATKYSVVTITTQTSSQSGDEGGAGSASEVHLEPMERPHVGTAASLTITVYPTMKDTPLASSPVARSSTTQTQPSEAPSISPTLLSSWSPSLESSQSCCDCLVGLACSPMSCAHTSLA